MLIRYKKSQEKIAMGLLSFMPNGNDLKALQETIREYESNDHWHLYFWKYEDDLIGLIGIKLEGSQAVIQHISVNPSFRNIGVGCKMVHEVKLAYQEDYEVVGNEDTDQFLRLAMQRKAE